MVREFSDVLNEFTPENTTDLLIGYDENEQLKSHSFNKGGELTYIRGYRFRENCNYATNGVEWHVQ